MLAKVRFVPALFFVYVRGIIPTLCSETTRSPLTSAKGAGREVQMIDELELSEPGITSALLAVLFLILLLFP